MLPFSTEFPVVPSENKFAFVAEIIAWLRGMKSQTILPEPSTQEVDATNIHVRSDSGEELRMRELRSGDSFIAIGARYDFPDEFGRIWRTECVLKRLSAEDDQDLVRLRTQCIAKSVGARLETPRKPYLIKSLISNNWGGKDKRLIVSDQPTWLQQSDNDVELAKAITFGDATNWLPIVYVAAKGKSSWVIDINKIEKLAYDLGGVAHVVVEPDREFSFKLRELTSSKNIYGSAIGISVPEKGIVTREYIGLQTQNPEDILDAVRRKVLLLRTQMPTRGWDWTELQERSLHAQRERERNRLSVEESEKLYHEEIANLQDRITELEQQVNTRPIDNINVDDIDLPGEDLVCLLGPELYSGEISDRLRFAAGLALSFQEQNGLDKRSKAIFERIVERLSVSPALLDLRQDLRRATTDPKRVSGELSGLLREVGYSVKSENKHLRLEADENYLGLEAITLPKTPSENRGLTNLRKQIERTLGITKLTDDGR